MFTAEIDAAAIIAWPTSPRELPAQHQLAQELSHSLQMLPNQPSLTDYAPKELLIYLGQQYIPRHAGSVLASGQLMVAPSTISTAVPPQDNL